MSLTPTSQSSFIAGVGLWAVGWSALFKLDKIPLLKRLFTTSRKEATLNWMAHNKVVTLLGTEALNFGVHGISKATAVTLALGGTFMNLIMIFVWLPIRQYRKGKHAPDSVLRGVA